MKYLKGLLKPLKAKELSRIIKVWVYVQASYLSHLLLFSVFHSKSFYVSKYIVYAQFNLHVSILSYWFIRDFECVMDFLINICECVLAVMFIGSWYIKFVLWPVKYKSSIINFCISLCEQPLESSMVDIVSTGTSSKFQFWSTILQRF